MMRDLRAGRASEMTKSPLPEPEDEFGPEATDSSEDFNEQLSEAIHHAERDATFVLVFRIRERILSLRQWSPNQNVDAGEVAVAVQERLRSIEPSMVLHRAKRNEILGFVPGHRERAEAEKLALTIDTGLTEPLGIGNGLLKVSPQIGAAVVDTENRSAVDLIDAATLALSETTRDSPFMMFDSSVRQRIDNEELTERDLAGAFEGRQFGVHFQPRLSLVDAEIEGLEAFVRWSHPKLGIVPTSTLLSLAEGSGQLFDVGCEVREAVLSTFRQWGVSNGEQAPTVWFNAAPAELFHSDFAEAVLDVHEHQAVRIGVEIADGPLLDERVLRSRLEWLAERNVPLGLDNVTAETLNLGRIKSLPFSAVNIDGSVSRTLTIDPLAHVVAEMTTIVAHETGAVVTLCQVETKEALQEASSLGMDQVQGDAICQPCSAEELRENLTGVNASRIRRRVPTARRSES